MNHSFAKKNQRSLIFLMIVFFNYNLFAVTAPDNSKVNERMEDNKELNSQDQGASDVDIRLTQRIRRDVVNQDDLSTAAKNIKIITIGGKVTLKGPVKTMDEKNKIQNIAVRVAGAQNVANEITVIK